MSGKNSLVSRLLVECLIPEGAADSHTDYYTNYAREEFLRLLKWRGATEEPESYLVEVQRDLFSKSISVLCSAYTHPFAFNRKIIVGGPC